MLVLLVFPFCRREDWVQRSDIVFLRSYKLVDLACFLKSLFVTILFALHFGFLAGVGACGILALWSGIKPAPPALEDEVLSTGLPGKSLFLKYIFYWCSWITMLCVNYCCDSQESLCYTAIINTQHCNLYILTHNIVYTHTHTLPFSFSFPLWFITGYWIQIPVLHSRTLLFTHSVYNSLLLLISSFQSNPLLPLAPLAITSLLSMSLILLIFLFHR